MKRDDLIRLLLEIPKNLPIKIESVMNEAINIENVALKECEAIHELNSSFITNKSYKNSSNFNSPKAFVLITVDNNQHLK